MSMGVYQYSEVSRMRIFILKRNRFLGASVVRYYVGGYYELGSMPIYRGSKNENLHSGIWVRKFGVCQSTGEAGMRIFIQAFGSGGWEYANLLGFQE